MGGINFKEIAIAGAGCWLLLERGLSWTFIAGVALVAVGATRIFRNF